MHLYIIFYLKALLSNKCLPIASIAKYDEKNTAYYSENHDTLSIHCTIVFSIGYYRNKRGQYPKVVALYTTP